MSKIEINNVYKIFGSNPQSVMPMVKDGANKEEVLEQTGHTVGLDNVSLKIEEGETFVCMGLSGSGKSTLIRHLNRLIDPTDGEILVEGTNVMSFNKDQLIEFRRHKMSMVFQRFGLFPHKTVIQNVGYGLEMQGKPEDERNRVAMEKIDAVGLNGFENQFPNQLSGGMQQRVGLARALATSPGLLLLDEPFSNLDSTIKESMKEEIFKIVKETNTTTILVTHDINDALNISDRILIFKAGILQQYDDPVKMYCEPANCYCAEVLGDMNKLFHKNETYYIRPEKVNISDKRSKYRVKVEKCFFQGKEYKVKGRINNEIWHFFSKSPIKEDSNVYVNFPEKDLIYFDPVCKNFFKDPV